MRIVYSPRYHIDIGSHVFPTAKYGLLAARVRAAGLVTAFDEPPAATWDELAFVHGRAYLEKLQLGTFRYDELAQLEIPWAPEVVEGFRLMVGGTLRAARLATEPASGCGVVVHLGGGLHHAFADHGEGFCLFNDVAVAIRMLQREGRARRMAIVDLDVHQGNGTAAIFARDSQVFTCSIHQQANYPFHKPPSSLDIGLADGTGDDEYLEQVETAMRAVTAFRPDVVFYLAGADPYEGDQLGGLSLTRQGLRHRDALVLRESRAAGACVTVTLAGGYARHVDDTVDIHFATVEEAVRST